MLKIKMFDKNNWHSRRPAYAVFLFLTAVERKETGEKRNRTEKNQQ